MLLNALALAAVATVASAIAVNVEERAAITDFDTTPIAWAFPPGRSGFTASAATTAPCGGAPMGARTNFPMSGGDLALTQKTSLDNVNFLYTHDSNPSRFHAFATYTNTILDIGAGHYCAKAPDFASLNFTAGDNATLLIIYQLDSDSSPEHSYYYTCADIALVEPASFTPPTDSYVCGNYTAELKVASDANSLHMGTVASNATGTSSGGGSSSSSGTSATSSDVSAASAAATAGSSDDSGLSAAAGGGIGAAVALVVLALVAAGAYMAGYLRFGKKRQTVRLDTASDSSAGVPTKHAHA